MLKRIELRGFGLFETKSRKTGTGRNPCTGEVVDIAPGNTVRFKGRLHPMFFNRREVERHV